LYWKLKEPPSGCFMAQETILARISALLGPCFAISGSSAFDLRDFNNATHCVGRSCLEAVSAMELRLLVGGGPCAEHGQGQSVTVQVEILERTALFDIAFSVSARTTAGDPFDFAASSGLKQ
jgi:hypothetical protein